MSIFWYRCPGFQCTVQSHLRAIKPSLRLLSAVPAPQWLSRRAFPEGCSLPRLEQWAPVTPLSQAGTPICSSSALCPLQRGCESTGELRMGLSTGKEEPLQSYVDVGKYLNIKLTDISVTDPEKYPHMLSVKNCFIRGSVVRYVQLPADEVDTQLLQDAARKEAMQQKQ
ncbi:UNVERIFIED_CONTAM: hypothetical protein FKN15_059942 [Acipenser sinensis]